MNIFITFDYEIFFSRNHGSVEKCIIEPIEELIKISEKTNNKFIFFVDSGYLLKLKEYKNKFQAIKKDYDLVFKNLEKLANSGHDIQLHIHPHWEKSYYDGNKWIMDLNAYRLHCFKENEIFEIVSKYKNILNEFNDKVFAFRGGGWCIQPFDKIKNALKQNNIYLDSTVFYGGVNKSQVHYFDFAKAPKKDIWKFENDPLIEDTKGFFTEVPISSIKVPFYFYWKFAYYKKFAKNSMKQIGDGQPVGLSKKNIFKLLLSNTYAPVSCDSFRSSLLNKSYNIYKKEKRGNFVVIGHPKGQSIYSLNKLSEFLSNKNTVLFKDIF